LKLIGAYKDADLGELMTELGGHCMETILEAFDRASQDDAPRFFIAYTVKGLRLPFQGHKDNHAGLMTEGQIAELRARLGVIEGEEWDRVVGFVGGGAHGAEGSDRSCAVRRQRRARSRCAGGRDPVA
jgi:pyruvate dehydrogenase E1 component